jgi:hypothetical protein
MDVTSCPALMVEEEVVGGHPSRAASIVGQILFCLAADIQTT